jgi:ABC-type lipoprotein release transport system permease subunit
VRVVVAWLSLELRRRWRSLAVLALLVAVAGGTVLASVAGTRRGDTVLDRLAARTRPATAVVLPNRPGFDWDRVRAFPEVEALSTFLLGLDFPVDGIPDGAGFGFPPGDDEIMRTLEVPVLFSGRLPDPARPDEAVVTPEFSRRQHLGVGGAVTAHLYTPQQVAAASKLDQDPGTPAGPAVRIRIVGVGMPFWGHDIAGSGGGLLPSPGFAREYRANFYDERNSYANALVRLRGGEVALPAFQAHLAAVTGRGDIDVWNLPAQQRQEQRALAFQARALLAFGAAALLAAMFLVGQALARMTSASIADLQVLRAVGMTPRQAVLAAAAGPALAALAGAALAVVAAAVASAWFPIGSAALAEPSPGFDADLAVLGLGLVAIPLLVLAGAVASASVALRATRAGASARRSAAATLAARAGLPVPVVIGTRFALESGRGRTAVPVRPALLGAVAGVLGVLGAFTFANGVADAAATPARFGQTWQLYTFLGYNDADIVPNERDVLAAVARDPDVTAVNDARIAVAHGGPADSAVSLFTYDPVGSPIRTVLVDGRMPTSDTELVLAPTAATMVGAGIGDVVRFTASTSPRDLTVVGIGFVPSSPHNEYDSGGWLTPGGYRSLFGDKLKFHFALVGVRPGVSVEAVQARLQQAAGNAGAEGVVFVPPDPPAAIGLLREVRVLPVALGVFLLLLALGAVGHALATAVRRRRIDVAVLRALGMTRLQSRGVVVTQASVLALVGLVFGIPLGVALGRTIWRVVADYTPVEYVPPVAVLALLLVVPCALLVANLLAAFPGHQASRLRIGHVLRAE